jgi:hypothetical protein
MIHLERRTLNRRTLLRGAGGVALALPWLEIMSGKEAQAALPPKRMLTYFFANGMIPKDYECQGGEYDFTLSKSLMPLERHKQQLIVTHGIGMSCRGFAHTDATPHVLTGMRHPPDHAEHGSFRAAITTLDQEVAKVVGAGTRYPSLEVGIHSGTDRLSTISWRSPTEMNVPRQDPYALAAEIFGVEPPPGQQIDPERQKRLDKTVLDAVYESAKSLSQRLGREDRARLDAHIQAVHELEERLNTTDAPGGMASMLEKPNWVMGQKINIDATENIPLVFEMMMDLVTYALATDQTRVVTFMAGRSFGGFSLPWVDAAGDWHEFSHQAAAGDGGATEKMTRIVTWLETQLALLCDKLKAVQEPGGGSLLDNMTVCQMNEFGYDHQHRNLPYLFIGSGQGYFKTGRLLRFEQFSDGPDNEHPPFPGTWNNNVLVSLANMMGLELDHFGDPNYPHGPIERLRG